MESVWQFLFVFFFMLPVVAGVTFGVGATAGTILVMFSWIDGWEDWLWGVATWLVCLAVVAVCVGLIYLGYSWAPHVGLTNNQIKNETPIVLGALAGLITWGGLGAKLEMW
jgi:uncharacterized membrane protein